MSDLSVQEVRNRLISYDSEDTTTELYEFGKMLVGECVDRVHKIDSKATMPAGYAGTIIALLVSTSAIWKSTIDKWAVGFIFGAGLAALACAAYALWSFSPKTFDWFSDNEWFDKDYLRDHENLRRYHVLAMHNVVRSHGVISAIKTTRIKTAQEFLGISALLLFLALADALGAPLLCG